MARSKTRLFLFRLILVGLVWGALEGVGYLGLWLNSRSLDFLSNKNYFRLRAMLMGNDDPELFPRYLSQPYLGYIPYPGYQKNGVRQHNMDGYRGEAVPRQKSGKLRVLCMGGSTTYGYGVALPSETYPARLEQLLADYVAQDTVLRRKYPGVEVINAGLEAGNSAEELEQYLLKYRYYNPDIVVVHSGVNDAFVNTYSDTDFQLDYTNHRRLSFHLKPLSQPARWMMHSYFFSFVAIRLFFGDFSESEDQFMHQGKQPFCKWSHINQDSILAARNYSYYPFYRNSRSLYGEIVRDGAALVVLPNVLNPQSPQVQSNPKYRDLARLNTELSRGLAAEFGGMFVPFTYDSIKNPASWLDDCHLDAAGENEKARILYREIIKRVR